MKKLILSTIICFLLVLGGILVWNFAPIWAKATGIAQRWFDVLAAAIFIAAIIPSCYFSEGLDELKNEKPC